MDKHFGNVIWTNHVLERLNQRGVKQSDAWAVWKRPDSSSYNKQKDAWIFKRKFGNLMIEVVAKKNEKKQWIILSVWQRRIFDKQYKEQSLLKKLKNLIFG
jgi:hypothetical protein